MKTTDGHKIRESNMYFCVKYDSFGAPKITKCMCTKVGRENFGRDQVAIMKYCVKRKYDLIFHYNNAKMFKDLTKAKAHCLKIMETLKEDFETAINNRVNAIKRTRR